MVLLASPAPPVPVAPRAVPDFDELLAQSPAALKEGIENEHPAAYFVLAQRLFTAGEKDEAVFWFFVGQIRYRAYLADPGRAAGGEQSLLQTLWEAVERPINDYAFNDVRALAATIARALAWDDLHTDAYAPKDRSREQVRRMMRRMKRELLACNNSTRGRVTAAACGC